MTPRSYASPEPFRQALEQRLRANSGGGGALARHRQLLVFDRFLARIAAVFGDAAILKGGLVLELRLHRARTTKDVDLRLQGESAALIEKLRICGRLDMGDYMAFEIAADPDHPEIQNDGMIYEGQRFKVRCTLGGRLYGNPFGVDVVYGEPIHGQPDTVTTADTLGFAGIEPPTVRVYPVETHIAEKLHAFTMPRPSPNSRVKDLPDIALLATVRSLHASALRAALEQTFSFRSTHALPDCLPNPPPDWAPTYHAIAQADELPWPDLPSVTNAARLFLDPVLRLAGEELTWEPSTWSWSPVQLGAYGFIGG